MNPELNLEAEPVKQAPILDSDVSAEQKVEYEARLKQKLDMQEELMGILHFIPEDFDPTNFEHANDPIVADKEARALIWMTVENKDGETNMDIFRRIYDKQIEKFPNKVLSNSELTKLRDRVFAEFQLADYTPSGN